MFLGNGAMAAGHWLGTWAGTEHGYDWVKLRERKRLPDEKLLYVFYCICKRKMKQNKLITILIGAKVAISQCCSRESLPHQPLYHTMGRRVKTVFLFGTEKTESSLFVRSISVFASPSCEDVLVLAVIDGTRWRATTTYFG